MKVFSLDGSEKIEDPKILLVLQTVRNVVRANSLRCGQILLCNTKTGSKGDPCNFSATSIDMETGKLYCGGHRNHLEDRHHKSVTALI